MANYNINCPHCGIVLTVQPEWSGLETTCPNCQKTFSVPPAPSAGNPVPATPVPALAQFNMNCPHCGQILTVQPEWSGMELGCPNCQKSFIVPPVPGAGTRVNAAPRQAGYAVPGRSPVGKADSDAQKVPDTPRNQNADNAVFRLILGVVLPIPFAVSAIISGFKGLSEAKKLPAMKGENKSQVCIALGICELIVCTPISIGLLMLLVLSFAQ